jgi:hypothetical protein
MVALYAARNAGIAVPESAIQKGIQFLLHCQHQTGGFGYTSNAAPNAARTAIGCLILALAKEKDSKAFKNGIAFLKRTPSETHYEQYYLYYAAQAYFHAAGAAWEEWNGKNIKSRAATQNADGSWGSQFGPSFGTAASLLSLAVNYRFLPIYER